MRPKRLVVAGALCLTQLVLRGAEVRAADPPAAKESGMPFLTKSPDGKVFLSWVDMLGAQGHALRVSRWTGNGWDAPETIATGRNWFANWADVPSINALSDGSMLAHWMTKLSGGGTYDYGIRVARRDPASGKWSEIHGMHLEQKADYAGFLAFVPGEGKAVYLAPPPPSSGDAHAGGGGGDHHHHDGVGHRKTMRFIAFAGDRAAPSGDVEVDADTCSCCPTGIAKTPAGLIAAYRDHQSGEIRDISITRQVGGKWTKPAAVHADNWQINGCPTEGPSLAAKEESVAVAWLTRAGGVSKVQIAISNTSGERFGKPLQLDSGNPLGRPALAALGGTEKRFAAIWVEKVTAERNEIRLRYLLANGTLSSPQVIANVPAGRLAGIPRIVANGDGELLVAWRDKRVRVARIAIDNKTRTFERQGNE